MFCNKWIKKNLILGSAVIFGGNLINGCSNIGKVDNLANALYEHCMKNKDLKIGPTTFTKDNAKNFAELFGKMVKLTEYLEAKGKGLWGLPSDKDKLKEANNIAQSVDKNLENDNFITKLNFVITFITGNTSPGAPKPSDLSTSS